MTSLDNASSKLLTEDAYAPSRLRGSWCGACNCLECWFPIEIPHVPNHDGYVPFCRCPPCLNARAIVRDSKIAWEDWSNSFEHANKQTEIWEAAQQRILHATNTAATAQQLGPREFTLTYGSHYETPDEAKRVMEQAIDRLKRYYKDEIIEFHAIGEYTQAGRPHIHGWYHLDGGRKITDKNFKRAYPPWNPKKKLGRGFEGGHHATIARVSDFHGYTEKHLEEAWLVENITNANDNSGPEAPSRILEGKHPEGPQGTVSEEVAGSTTEESRGINREDGDESDR